jgi:hypothetical protein
VLFPGRKSCQLKQAWLQKPHATRQASQAPYSMRKLLSGQQQLEQQLAMFISPRLQVAAPAALPF